MIHIRQMALHDLPLGLRLSAQAGWNQTEADWRRFLRLEPDGCFVAQWANVPVATTAALVFGPIGWIAMVLVDESFRHRGIASQLVERALEYLARRGVQTARLDATPLGRPVYERLGFLPEYSLVRVQTDVSPPAAGPGFVPLAAERVEEVCELDQRVTGTPRGRLIRALYGERPEAATASFSDAGIAGYAMRRPGRRASQIGPAVALAPQIGEALLDQVLHRCPAGPVLADIPTDNIAAMQWAESRRFTVQREFTRMYRGQPVADFPDRIWASSGPEKG
jgi:GNAT superfamily N-acetyltransferase